MATHHHGSTHVPPGTDARGRTTDPVCGMTVSPERAAGVFEYQGEPYFFCSTGCLQQFQAEPARYTAAPSPHTAAVHGTVPPTHAAGEYTCPMHPEVRQTGPGACPHCGMALEPATPAVPVTRTVYTCPMHPEIIRDAPGSCPICGMALEPTTVTAEEEVNPELVDMTRRFWVSVALTAPLVLYAMAEMLVGTAVAHLGFP